MSKSLLQTRILDKLEVIMTQVDTMNKFGKNIPIIHLDILKSNIRVLYEQICELERVQTHTEVGQHATRFSAAAALDNSPQRPVEIEEKAIVTQAAQVIAEAVEAIQHEVEEEFVNAVPISLPVDQEISQELVPEVMIPESPDEIFSQMQAKVDPTAEIDLEMKQNDPMDQLTPEHPTVESKETSLFELDAPTLHFSFDDETSDADGDSASPLTNPIPDIFASLQTISERYNNPDSSIHGVISAAQVATVNSHVKTIRDLKAAIGVNEKFLFINDLFMGNMKEYTDTILALNEAGNLGDVPSILSPLKSKYKWSEEGIAYQTLMDFIRRRFA